MLGVEQRPGWGEHVHCTCAGKVAYLSQNQYPQLWLVYIGKSYLNLDDD